MPMRLRFVLVTELVSPNIFVVFISLLLLLMYYFGRSQRYS